MLWPASRVREGSRSSLRSNGVQDEIPRGSNSGVSEPLALGGIAPIESGAGERFRKLITLLYGLYGLSLAAPIWLTPYFPTEDGPAHIYWTEVYRSLGDAQSPFQPYYERSVRWNTPNLSYFALQLGLSRYLDP